VIGRAHAAAQRADPPPLASTSFNAPVR
jgi:hypothetical protein